MVEVLVVFGVVPTQINGQAGFVCYWHTVARTNHLSVCCQSDRECSRHLGVDANQQFPLNSVGSVVAHVLFANVPVCLRFATFLSAKGRLAQQRDDCTH